MLTRPRDLARAQLKELRLLLDARGFSEAYLQSAFKDACNEDIAASILEFIRQMALKSPLRPYAERVDAGVRRLAQHHLLNDLQRKWLDRIAAQLKAETVVDRDAFDRGAA